MEDLLYILQLTASAYKEANSTGVFVIDSDAKLEEAKKTLPAKVYIDNYYLQVKLERLCDAYEKTAEELEILKQIIAKRQTWWQRLLKPMSIKEEFEHELEIKRTC